MRRVERRPDADLDPRAWPATVPAVAQLLAEGMDLGPATVLVGEDGSGRSTLVEGLAVAFGLDVGGGTAHTAHRAGAAGSRLGPALGLVRGAGASRWGCFLRAETMHGVFSTVEPGDRDPAFLEMSHGESFQALLGPSRFHGGGLHLMDEPESALSSSGCLGLVRVLHELVAGGTAQVVVAMHSPVVAALPGARILQVGDEGLHEVAWEDLALVARWRGFLDAPQRYLGHLLDRPREGRGRVTRRPRGLAVAPARVVGSTSPHQLRGGRPG